jgi:isochorismate hydrolase
MQEAFGMEIPETLEEACDPGRAALLVYDMQVGVLQQVPERGHVIEAASSQPFGTAPTWVMCPWS